MTTEKTHHKNGDIFPPFYFQIQNSFLILAIVSILFFQLVNTVETFLSTKDYLHFGLILSNASNLDLGYLPHKEITIQYGIVTTYIQYLFCKVFGFDFLSLAIATFTFYLIHLFFIFQSVRIFCSFPISLLTILFVQLFSLYIPYPWADFYSAAFLSVLIYCILTEKHYLAILFCILTVFARYTYAPIAGILFLYTVYSYHSPRKKIFYYSFGIFVILNVLLYFATSLTLLEIKNRLAHTVSLHSHLISQSDFQFLTIILDVIRKALAFDVSFPFLLLSILISSLFFYLKRADQKNQKLLVIFFATFTHVLYLTRYGEIWRVVSSHGFVLAVLLGMLFNNIIFFLKTKQISLQILGTSIFPFFLALSILPNMRNMEWRKIPDSLKQNMQIYANRYQVGNVFLFNPDHKNLMDGISTTICKENNYVINETNLFLLKGICKERMHFYDLQIDYKTPVNISSTNFFKIPKGKIYYITYLKDHADRLKEYYPQGTHSKFDMFSMPWNEPSVQNIYIFQVEL